MHKFMVAMSGLSLVLFAGCMQGPQTQSTLPDAVGISGDNEEVTSDTDTSNQIVPPTEDADITQFFEYLEKTIEEEEQNNS